MTELNHETFDLTAVLTGAVFPENEVDVFFDESVGFAIYQAQESLRVAEIKGNEDALKTVLEEVEALKKKAQEVKYKVTVRGIPESTRKTCIRKAQAAFPPEYSFLGQETPSPDRDDLFNSLLWAASITKVTSPSGAVALPSEADIKALRDSVGRSVVATISQAINELVEGTKAGFESAAQDTSFLSGASPEA